MKSTQNKRMFMFDTNQFRNPSNESQQIFIIPVNVNTINLMYLHFITALPLN